MFLLTINRVMGLCPFKFAQDDTAPRPEGLSLAQSFKKQMEDVDDHRLSPIYAMIAEEAEEHDYKMTDNPGHDRSTGRRIMIVQDAEPDAPAAVPGNPMVGLFRSRRVQMTKGEATWDLRIRPSITACALARKGGLTKLWWTFEGVPACSTADPPLSEQDAVDFVAVTNRCANAAIPLLREAYIKSFSTALDLSGDARSEHNERLRVSFADNNGRSFSKLIDALYLEGAPFGEIRRGGFDAETRKGAKELIEFIQKTGSERPKDNAVKLNAGDLPGLAAAYSNFVHEENEDGSKTHIVTGLASSSRMLPSGFELPDEWRRATFRPEHVRSASAARPLSKQLANDFAREIELGAMALH